MHTEAMYRPKHGQILARKSDASFATYFTIHGPAVKHDRCACEIIIDLVSYMLE